MCKPCLSVLECITELYDLLYNESVQPDAIKLNLLEAADFILK
jgi:hypothetical protein